MSNMNRVQEELRVGRGDPVYMAHGYLTKVPVGAITPFIETHTASGDTVLDPFAGSGMTGVAAVMTGRRARLFDISVLGQHIGSNYVNLVDGELLHKVAGELIDGVRDRLGEVYACVCSRCGSRAQLAKTVWSFEVACGGCSAHISYYQALRDAEYSKRDMKCPRCSTAISAKDAKVGERAEIDYVVCSCSPRQIEQPHNAVIGVDLVGIEYPRVHIGQDRQMYQASALGKSGMTEVASFYSPRNLAVLTVLHDLIRDVDDEATANKLLFAFTASLTRASKRYQWSPTRPLNAANANYYVAPVFYEWNVLDLFLRKVEAAIRSDDWIRSHAPSEASDLPDVTYANATAVAIPLPDACVDYVFTDPPFGSNLFYADMALFQEAWLGGFTDEGAEAVVDRGRHKRRTAVRYEQMLTAAFSECRRVLKPGGQISVVFGNSTGAMWALLQRAIHGAGFAIDPDQLVVLNKGQRSVKGLASGFEHVATLDLIITMRATSSPAPVLTAPLPETVAETVRAIARSSEGASPSHVYLELLRHGIRHAWDLSELDLRVVTRALIEAGWCVDSARGDLLKPSA